MILKMIKYIGIGEREIPVQKLRRKKLIGLTIHYTVQKLQNKLVGRTKEEQAGIIESFNIPTKELEKFVTAQKHVNDGISRMMSTLNIEGYNTSFL